MSYEETQLNEDKSLENSVKIIADHLQLMEKSVKYISGYLKFDLKKDLATSIEPIYKGLSAINGEMKYLGSVIEKAAKSIGGAAHE